MIKKIAQPPYWQKVVQKVKTLGLRPEIVSMLNNFNQIVWDASPPPSNPNALAYVSSGDMNDDETWNILDVILVINLILYGSETECDTTIADMNQDESIDVIDIVLIVNTILDNY